MGFLFRSAVFMGFLALAFAAVYWLGDHRLDDVADRLAALKGDLAEKTSSLDRDVAVLKRRAALAEARGAVNRAGEALGRVSAAACARSNRASRPSFVAWRGRSTSWRDAGTRSLSMNGHLRRCQSALVSSASPPERPRP